MSCEGIHLCAESLGTMASLSLTPVNIFKAGADEERAETARLSSFIGAIAVGDLVKSTLGPKGMVRKIDNGIQTRRKKEVK
uniref:T-complex protein 1 subunit beta n=1 Tax=Callithrix jacchus TaxID=9483 RepID=A0A8I4A4X7_CALJA